MQYSMMKGGAQYRVEIPQLSGGVNLSDLPTQVEDNQLTDVCNMWWHQGVLRTRPGLKEVAGGSAFSNGTLSKSRISEREEILFHVVDGDETHIKVQADSFSSDGADILGQINISARTDGKDTVLGVKVEDTNDTNYEPYLFFASDGTTYRAAKEGENMLPVSPYIPLVTVERRNEDGSVSNVKFEDYNMLTGEFECSFSTDGERDTFYLPQKDLDKYVVTVRLTLYDTETKTTRKVNMGIFPSDNNNVGYTVFDGVEIKWSEIGMFGAGGKCSIYARFDWASGTLNIRGRQTADSSNYTELPLPQVTSNNLTIQARKTQEGQKETVCRMTKATWFGGTRSGLDSGSRLFVTSNPDKPHLVHWSDVNKPLYFPENNYFYVGDADQKVTGFGKQGDLLILFKEHEIYCTQYVAGSTITADDLISGAVTDIAALTAQFPLTPLHPTIGCDCPDTIRLVNNRLVWATSDAHVYMLTSVNQYSERNVRDITALIRRDLEKHTAAELKAAVATEYKGHYMLILPDGTAYLLDVGNSAFQSYTYYASEKKANRALPWYIWKLGKDGERFLSAVSTGDEIRLLANDVTNRVYTLEGEDDGGEPIECSFTTKLFDFGRGDKLKAVREMYLRVGGVPNSCVHISYLFDDAEFEDVYRIEPTEDGELYDAGYIRSYRVTPNVNRARLFGLRFDSDGAMAVEGIGLNYSIQGVIR